MQGPLRHFKEFLAPRNALYRKDLIRESDYLFFSICSTGISINLLSHYLPILGDLISNTASSFLYASVFLSLAMTVTLRGLDFLIRQSPRTTPRTSQLVFGKIRGVNTREESNPSAYPEP